MLDRRKLLPLLTVLLGPSCSDGEPSSRGVPVVLEPTNPDEFRSEETDPVAPPETEPPDTTPPVFEGIVQAGATSEGYDLSWRAAQDDRTEESEMAYLLCVDHNPGGCAGSFTPAIRIRSATKSRFPPGTFDGTSDLHFLLRAEDKAGNVDSNLAEIQVKPPPILVPQYPARAEGATSLSFAPDRSVWFFPQASRLHPDGELWGMIGSLKLKKASWARFGPDQIGWSLDEFSLLVSADGGASWQRRALPIIGERGQILVEDALRVWYFDSQAGLWLSENGGASWKRRTPPGGKPVSHLEIAPNGTLWAVAGLSLHRSTDRAENWESIPLPVEGKERVSTYDLAFKSDGRGVLVGSWHLPDERYYDRNRGFIFLSSADGSNWALAGELYQGVKKVQFLDASNGFALGDGSILETLDGGLNWGGPKGGDPARYEKYWGIGRGVDAWWISGSSGLYRRTDGSEDWETIPSQSFEGSMDSIAFPSPTRGLVVSAEATTFSTTDGGTYWIRKGDFTNTPPAHRIEFMDERHGWVVADGGVVWTTADAGHSWKATGKPSISSALYGLHAFSPDHFWVSGANELLAETIDGGETWTAIQRLGGKILFDVVFENEQRGWAVGQEGRILETLDGGKSWSPVSTVVAGTWSVVRLADANVWIGGEGRLYKLDPTTKELTATDCPAKEMVALHICPTGRTWTLSRNSGLYVRDEDPGSWTRVADPLHMGDKGGQTLSYQDLAVVDCRLAWVSGTGGYIGHLSMPLAP